jgi:hypothetical protein
MVIIDQIILKVESKLWSLYMIDQWPDHDRTVTIQCRSTSNGLIVSAPINTSDFDSRSEKMEQQASREPHEGTSSLGETAASAKPIWQPVTRFDGAGGGRLCSQRLLFFYFFFFLHQFFLSYVHNSSYRKIMHTTCCIRKKLCVQLVVEETIVRTSYSSNNCAYKL